MIEVTKGHLDISVGIVTALPIECVSVSMVIDDLIDERALGDPNRYRSGWLPSRDERRQHRVVVALQARDGSRNAAAMSADMIRSFPSLQVLVLCGVAGGIPSVQGDRDGVRLGDIVVATEGIIDYGHVRSVNGLSQVRRPVEGLSMALLRADHELEMRELRGDEPWRRALQEAMDKFQSFRRPSDDADPLVAPAGPLGADRMRAVAGNGQWPQIHRGRVGSADRLLRDVSLRDDLAERYELRAVEMEGSGVAASADLHGQRWFMVRGVVDYCDNATKSDAWHRYSSLAAASYMRALLAECPPFLNDRKGVRVGLHGLSAIVEALIEIQAMKDDYQRRAILAALPEHIRTAIPDSVSGRLHIVALVRTCEDYPDGQESLLEALQLSLGSTSPEFQRVEEVIRNNWAGR